MSIDAKEDVKMKCDELKDYDIMDIEAMDDERLEKSESGKIQVTRVYIKSEADKMIAGLKARTAELEALNHDLCERVTENDEIRLHWEEIEQTRAENERMKARIAELEEERRWRKFSEETPEWGIDVLVIDKNCDIHIVRFSHDFKWISWGKMNTCESDCITHWMPLPKGPEDK